MADRGFAAAVERHPLAAGSGSTDRATPPRRTGWPRLASDPAEGGDGLLAPAAGRGRRGSPVRTELRRTPSLSQAGHVTRPEGPDVRGAASADTPPPDLRTVLGEVLLLTLELGAAVGRVVEGFGGRPIDASNGLAPLLALLRQQSELWLDESAREPLDVWRRDYGLPSLQLWRRVAALAVGPKERADAVLAGVCEQLRVQLVRATVALPTGVGPVRYNRLPITSTSEGGWSRLLRP